MEFTDGRKWGLLGIVLLVLYYAVSMIITAFISVSSITKVAIMVMGVVFAFLAMYTGIMAFKNGSKVFGIINILLGLIIVIATVGNLIATVQKTVSNLPTF